VVWITTTYSVEQKIANIRAQCYILHLSMELLSALDALLKWYGLKECKVLIPISNKHIPKKYKKSEKK